MKVVQTLRKWGNGTGLRLPKEVLEAADLTLDQSVIVTTKGGSIILTPVREHQAPSLQSLLKGVTPALVAGEYAWSADTGSEAYE